MKASVFFPACLFLFAIGLSATAATLDEAQALYNATNYAAAVTRLQGAPEAASLRLLGRCYLAMEDLNKATDTLEKAVAADPRNSDGYRWLGEAYGLKAQKATFSAASLAIKTRENFEKAYSLDPKNWDAANDLFEFYLEAPGFMGGGLEKAARMADVIAGHDGSEGAVARARIAERRKDYPAAEQQFRSAIQLAPTKPMRHVELARFFAHRQRFPESDAEFAQALQAAPNTPEVVYARASVLIQTNRNLAEARELLTRYLSLKLTPDDPSKQAAEKLMKKASGS